MTYRRGAAGRGYGLILTLLLHLCAGGAFLLGWHLHFAKVASEPTLTVFQLAAPASPPEMVQDTEKEAPEPVEQNDPAPPKPMDAPLEAEVKLLPSAPRQVAPPVETPSPKPPQPETARPRAIKAPEAPSVASEAPDSWEGRVLAHLNKHKRYPATARARRDQGIAWIRFTIDREGRLLSIRLEQGSGLSSLDREAVALPKRAQPLPPPPAERKGEVIELIVPVEFFLPR